MSYEINDDCGDWLEFFETVLHLLDNYVTLNPTLIMNESFENDIEENIYEYLINIYGETIDDDIFDYAVEYFFEYIYFRRSYPTDSNYVEINMSEISEKINMLNELSQNTQRTMEWHIMRSRMLTASNFYRIFDSECSRNNLINEKCVKVDDLFLDPTNHISTNEYSPFHHGHKYEPISVLIYEHLNNTKIGDYGCIKHPIYEFIGASPDGINIDATNNRLFGRLLEIKNPISREITGIPKKEYWVQMQLQMECCDLDHCDFLETSFIEYPTYQEYSLENTHENDENPQIKGVILQFKSFVDDSIIYKYKPLDALLEEWKKEEIQKHFMELRFIKEIYWKLNKYSCVYVKRNKQWFNDNLETIKEIWDIIQRKLK